MKKLPTHITILLAVTLCSFSGVDKTEWQHSYAKADVTVYHRSKEDLRYNEFMIKANLDGKIERINQVLETTEALTAWFPLCDHAELVEDQENRRVIYMTFNFPFPFKNRDAYLEVMRTSEKGKHYFGVHAIERPMRKGFVRVGDVQNITELNLSDNQIEVTQVTYLDPGGSIPRVFMNEGFPPALNNSLSALERLANVPHSINTNPAQ